MGIEISWLVKIPKHEVPRRKDELSGILSEVSTRFSDNRTSETPTDIVSVKDQDAKVQEFYKPGPTVHVSTQKVSPDIGR